MNAVPVVTRHDDGSLSVVGPDPCPREHLIAHELLVEMIDKHNEYIRALITVERTHGGWLFPRWYWSVELGDCWSVAGWAWTRTGARRAAIRAKHDPPRISV
jgi:hypothetical protein